MDITIFNFRDKIKPAILKKAEKLLPRELDEESKGHFIGFVDDGPDSFDVLIKLNAKGEVIQATCDCGSTAEWCVHRISLLANIGSGKKAKLPKVKAKKLLPYEQMLADADISMLKKWITGLLGQNKDLQLQFEHDFAPPKENYTDSEVKALTSSAVKSVVKNRTRIELTELKKIVDLWKKVHEPVVNYYFSNFQDPGAVILLHDLIVDYFIYKSKFDLNSNKITKYCEGIFTKVAHHILQIELEDVQNQLLEKHISAMDKHLQMQDSFYSFYLYEIFAPLPIQQKDFFVHAFVRHVQNKPAIMLTSDANKLLLKLLKESTVFSQYIRLVQTVTWNAEFNTELIDALIEHKHLQEAIDHSWKQVNENYNIGYQWPYYTRLKTIYLQQNNTAGLSRVAQATIFYSFDYEDYKLVIATISDPEEKNKLRTSMLSKARNAAGSNNLNAYSCLFSLLAEEQRYKKMLERIEYNAPYGLILTYFDQLYAIDKMSLLDKIERLSSNSYWSDASGLREHNSLYLEPLVKKIMEMYEASILIMVINNPPQRLYYGLNAIMSAIKERL